MRRMSISFLSLAAVLVGHSVPLYGDLMLRGTDTLGNRLIYDSDQNLTWYDLTNSTSPSDWYTHLTWADSLSVDFGGVLYDDWRLPTIAITEDPPLYGYGGTTTYGFNITSSEMGHLFYPTLGNIGRYDLLGNDRGAGNRLINTGPFTDLRSHPYYTDTSTNPVNAAYFGFDQGEQYVAARVALGGTGLYSIAVRQGDVAIPEPSSVFLLLFANWMLLSRKRSSKTG